MHVHLPKPLHGWRAFVGEVGIIVVGVLIALGAEQVVEDLHWKQKVDVVRRSLTGELGNDRARWEANMSFVPCARREIAALDRWAANAAPDGPAPTAPVTFGSLFWWMHSANWNLATGSETLDHFPIQDQLAFAALYDGVVHREADIESASDLSGQAAGLVPLATDAQGRRELRSVLGRLSGKIDGLASNDDYMKRHFDALGVKADRTDIVADDAKTPQCRS
jgi:hypothetical protein